MVVEGGEGLRLRSASRDQRLPVTAERATVALGAQWRQVWSSSGNVLRLTALGTLDTQSWDGDIRVLVTPGDDHILTWDDHRVSSWRTSDGRRTGTLAADGAPAAYGDMPPQDRFPPPWALSPSGRRLALSLPGRRVVQVVDAVTLRTITEMAPRRVSPPGAPGAVRGLAFVSDDELAVWGEGTLERWNLTEGRPGPLLPLNARPSDAVAVRPGTGEVAVAHLDDGRVSLLAPDAGRTLREFRLPGNDVPLRLGFSPEGNLLAIGDQRGGVSLVDMSSMSGTEQVVPGDAEERRVFGLLGEHGWFLSDQGSLRTDSETIFRQAPHRLLWSRPLPRTGTLLLARRSNTAQTLPTGLILLPLDPERRRAHACRATGLLTGWEHLLPDDVDRADACPGAPASPAPAWTLTPGAPPPAAKDKSAKPFTLSEAVAEMRSRDMEPENATVAPPGPLRAFVGVCASVNGRCRRLVFFHEGTLVRDREAHLPEIVTQDGTAVKVSYPTYRRDDPPGCPAGERVVVSYRWDGAAVVADRDEPTH